MAFVQQDTGRAVMWHKLRAATAAAHAYAREHQGHTQASVATWLRDVYDSGRQTHQATKKAAENPLYNGGLTEYSFTTYVTRVLRGRIEQNDLDALITHFNNYFWPIEQSWRQFRIKKDNRSYAEHMEHLLASNTLDSLANDLEGLIYWSKQAILSPYISNRYAEAAEAANAIVWQLSHLIESAPDSKRSLLTIASLRIAFYARLIRMNFCTDEFPLPLGITATSGFSKAETIILQQEFAHYDLLARSAMLGPTEPKQNEAVYWAISKTFALHHRLAYLLGHIEDGGMPIINDYPKDLPTTSWTQYRIGQSIKQQSVLAQRLFDFAIELETLNSLPQWLIDDDLYPALLIGLERLVDLYAGERFRLHGELTQNPFTEQLLALAGLPFVQSLQGGKIEKINNSAPLRIAKARTQVAYLGGHPKVLAAIGTNIMKAASLVKLHRHNITWSDLYTVCGEYFAAAGLQYGAIEARKKALLAIECLDEQRRKVELATEMQRALTMPMIFDGAMSEIDQELLCFIEDIPMFLKPAK